MHRRAAAGHRGEQIAPLLAYVEVEEDPTWQAVVGLRTLLRTLYSPIPVVPRPS